MSTTNDKIVITKAEGWIEVLSVSGFIVVNEHWDFEFAYSDAQPEDDFVGNKNEARVIENNDTSKLWVKTKTYTITIIPNEE